MESTILVSVLLLGVTIASTLDPIKVSMDAGGQCGSGNEPAFTQEVHLTSTGGAPNSYCNVRVSKDISPAGCKFSAVCVKVTNSRMTDCLVKLTLTGKMNDGTKDQTRELSCYSPFGRNTEWCVPSDLLVAEISGRKPEGNATKRDYAFNATVFSKCLDKPLQKYPLNPDDDYKNPDQDAADNWNRILGVIVGLCCSSVFLIILFITYCFYRSKPYSKPPSESREKLTEKLTEPGLVTKHHKPTPKPPVEATNKPPSESREKLTEKLPEPGLVTKHHKPTPKPPVEATKYVHSIDIRL